MTYARARSARKASLAEQQATIAVRADGGVRIAVVADTHSRPHVQCWRNLAKEQPDAILHAGDIGDLSVLDRLREIAPVFAVRGNIDGRGPNLPDLLDIALTRSDTDGATLPLLRLLLIHIGVNGPRLRADATRWARAKGAQLVVCGHSHVPFIGRDNGLMIFNPGSVGPRRFNLPIVYGVCELAAGRLQLWHVDCETGDRWAPP